MGMNPYGRTAGRLRGAGAVRGQLSLAPVAAEIKVGREPEPQTPHKSQRAQSPQSLKDFLCGLCDLLWFHSDIWPVMTLGRRSTAAAAASRPNTSRVFCTTYSSPRLSTGSAHDSRAANSHAARNFLVAFRGQIQPQQMPKLAQTEKLSVDRQKRAAIGAASCCARRRQLEASPSIPASRARRLFRLPRRRTRATRQARCVRRIRRDIRRDGSRC